jgi:cytochrome c556
MKRSYMVLFVAGILVLGGVTAGLSQGVLDSNMGSAEEVVKTRKHIMRAVGGNLGDLFKKLDAENLADVQVNADSIAALAEVLPPLYRLRYEQVYPVAGSTSFFKGAPAKKFEQAAERMRLAAHALKVAAETEDPKAAMSSIAALKASCGGCHKPYRGKY